MILAPEYYSEWSVVAVFLFVFSTFRSCFASATSSFQDCAKAFSSWYSMGKKKDFAAMAKERDLKLLACKAVWQRDPWGAFKGGTSSG